MFYSKFCLSKSESDTERNMFPSQLFSVESESDTERNMQGLGEGRRISSGLTEVIQF